jgi:hypothetical protein
MKLAEMLARSRLVSREKIEEAQTYAAENNGPMSRALVKVGAIDGLRLSEFLKRSLRINFVDLDRQPVAAPVLREVAGPIAYRLRVFPIALKKGRHEDVLWLGMTDPTDETARREVEITAGKKVVPLLVEEEALSRAIKEHYADELGSGQGEDTSVRKIGVAMIRAPDDLGGSNDDDLPVVGGALVSEEDEERSFSKVGSGDADAATEMMPAHRLQEMHSQKGESSDEGMDMLDALVGKSTRSIRPPSPQAADKEFDQFELQGPSTEVAEVDDDDLAWLRSKASGSGEGLSSSPEDGDTFKKKDTGGARNTAAAVAAALKKNASGSMPIPPPEERRGFGADVGTVPVARPHSSHAKAFDPDEVGELDAGFEDDIKDYVETFNLSAICLVSENPRVAQWLAKKLKAHTKKTYTAASLSAAANLCDTSKIPVVVSIKPTNDDDFLVGLTSLEIVDHPPRVVVVSENAAFDRISGISMRVPPLGNMEATLGELLTSLAKDA